MIHLLRRLKLTYALYNFFHRKELIQNVEMYKKYGLKKSYFSPISSKDFKHLKVAKQFEPSMADIEATEIFKSSKLADQQSIQDYNKNGYVILKNYISVSQADQINSEIDQLLKEKTVKFKYGNKIMFALHHSKLLNEIGSSERLIKFLSTLLGNKAILFQSINFIMGSEQHTHSDSIHMTTYPLGGLLGVWIALEDIDESNGALHYYPGSHLLPYYLNAEYDNEGNDWMIGKNDYHVYEEMMEQKIKELGIKKEIFRAKKGDLLIWHANLFHGGEPHPDKSRTRKSMVYHYFKKDAICYHEISQRPALLKRLK